MNDGCFQHMSEEEMAHHTGDFVSNIVYGFIDSFGYYHGAA